MNSSFNAFMNLVGTSALPTNPGNSTIRPHPPPSVEKETTENIVSQETTINILQSLLMSKKQMVKNNDNIDPFSTSNENVKRFSNPNNHVVFGENTDDPAETTPNFLKWKNDVWFTHFNQERSEEEFTRISNQPTKKKFERVDVINPSGCTIESDFLSKENRKKTNIDSIGLENDVKKKWDDFLSNESVQEKEEEDEDEGEGEGEGENETNLSSRPNYFGFRSPLQSSLSEYIFNYQDVLFTCADSKKTSTYLEIHETWILHIVNHITKSKRYQYYNDLKKMNVHTQGIYEVRDRGFLRPSVLILVPYKHDAYQIVNIMKKLVPQKFLNSPIANEEAFELFFGETYQKKSMKYRSDWRKKMFEGNIEDSFCVGIKISHEDGMVEFMVQDEFDADIIITTPIGLRSVYKRRKRFEDLKWVLSSIEICVMIRTELLSILQNWEMFYNEIWSSLNTLPSLKSIPEKANDPGQVRSFLVREIARKFRQTLIFSSLRDVDIENVFFRTENIRGKVRFVDYNLSGCLIPRFKDEYPKQSLLRIESPLSEIDQRRYDFFCNKMVPQILESSDVFLVLVSNYYEFARLRAFLSKEYKTSFISISDYDSNYALSLQRFRTEKTQIILYTERHYLTTPRVKISNFRVTQFLFYSLPHFGQHLYRRVMNHTLEMIKRIESEQKEASNQRIGKGKKKSKKRKRKRKNLRKKIMVRVLWSRYDKFKLERCFGVKATKGIMMSGKNNFII